VQLKPLSRRHTQGSIPELIADIQVIEKLMSGDFPTGNSGSHHENVAFAFGRTVGILGLASIPVILLIDPVVLDEVFRVFTEFVIVQQFFRQRSPQLMARLFDHFNMTSLHLVRHGSPLQLDFKSFKLTQTLALVSDRQSCPGKYTGASNNDQVVAALPRDEVRTRSYLLREGQRERGSPGSVMKNGDWFRHQSKIFWIQGGGEVPIPRFRHAVRLARHQALIDFVTQPQRLKVCLVLKQ
jgi:hypothetical protein